MDRKRLPLFFLLYASLYVAVSFTRFASAIALYHMTGFTEDLIRGLLVTYVPHSISGLLIARYLPHKESPQGLILLILLHCLCAVLLLYAFAHVFVGLVYCALLFKAAAFGGIDAISKAFLAKTAVKAKTIRRRIAFRQGVVFGAATMANGAGAAWLQYGEITTILFVEVAVALIFGLAFFGLARTEEIVNTMATPSPQPSTTSFLQSAIRDPWLRVLMLRSIGDGISVIALRTVLLADLRLTPAAAGLWSALIGLVAAVGMFLAPFMSPLQWRKGKAPMTYGLLLTTCGLLLVGAYQSTQVAYFVTYYIVACVPYCLADMYIQSTPFIHDLARSTEVAGLQTSVVAFGIMVGALFAASLGVLGCSAGYGLGIFFFFGLAGCMLITNRVTSYA